MATMRRTIAAALLAATLVATAACGTPPPPAEDVASDVGRGLAFVLTWAVLDALCKATPGCPHPICMAFPCSPTPPATAPSMPDPDPVAPA